MAAKAVHGDVLCRDRMLVGCLWSGPLVPCDGGAHAPPEIAWFRNLGVLFTNGRRRSRSGLWVVWPPLGHVGAGRNAWNHSGRGTAPCVVIATILS
eukprot:594051-Prymnesium_polylepis.1